MQNMPNVPMDDAHLQRYAVNAAGALRLSGQARPSRLSRSAERDLRRIETARRKLTEWAASQQKIPARCEWLMDNAYLAFREGKEAVRAFRRGRALRACRDGRTVLEHAAHSALWAVPDLEKGRLEQFLHAFQSALPLTERELSLFIPALGWAILKRLSGLCTPWEDLKQEGDAWEFAYLFTGLRALSAGDWSPLLERESTVEAILNRDPEGCYAGMEEETRARYRRQVCRLAREAGRSEQETAQRVLELSQKGEGPERHVGWFLFRAPMGKEQKIRSGVEYGLFVLAASVLLAGVVGWAVHSLPMALLLIFPMSDLVKNCVDFLVVRLVPPRSVPRMALERGIPEEGRTVCVIASLLTGEESGPALCSLLERYRLANRDAGEELRFGILADLPDSEEPMKADRRAWVDKAARAVEALNETYGGGFYLFFRDPAFQARDGKYLGWERKRGALAELVRLLKGRPTQLKVLAGDTNALSGTRYVITLDGDTSLNVGTARELVGAMLHPLNQPEIDRKRRVVVRGYGLLQPRISVELEAANQSLFSRVYGGQGGVDPYGSSSSDVYHDLYDQGTYTGKGIFQVDAYYTCLEGRFPEGRILSHDLLEGAYLHGGLLGEVELTDGFPQKVRAYFARLHRWVRGDWQILSWLGRTVPAPRGAREKNPLPVLARWKILDNLRRSLSPVFTLAALLLGLYGWGGVFAAAGTVAVLAAASNLLLSGAELWARRGSRSHGRYHSTIVAGFAGVVVQTALQLVLLPVQSFVCLTAAVTALWRTYVTKRDLLSWVTAAQSEKSQRDTLLSYYRLEWFSLAVGLATMWLAQLRFGALVGLVWAAAPAIAWYISRKVRPNSGLAPRDRAFLLHEATLIWRYFADFLRPEDHYLPPDNYQEQPAAGLARRTSPTNIGLGLLSILAAADLDLLPRKRGTELISRMLDTLEGLESWHGHLYNWYDTASARPLEPRYVSTVDSGNLCAALIALREGLYEWGEDVPARRAEVLSNRMDFTRLYDPERRLFSIGYECRREKLTEGWYDLMASEARQTSYLAVARGEVPPRHWRKLGRMLLGENDYSGMASWTGTMFEYFMPNLLLPCEENSLMYESLSFCVYAQKRRGAKARAPWGVSESAFYAFDPGMSYQYKAHGVQALGLKRGLDRELVVAPYASFLALPLAPKSAAANLRRLRDMGLEGRYGLYEAVDYTPSRCRGGQGYEVVRSYMAHHLGMSLVAVDNALRENVMQRRFLRDRAMGAYRELLQERVPVGAPVMRRGEREVPEKPKRYENPAPRRAGEGASCQSPQCQLISDGSYTILAFDNGLTCSRLRNVTLTLAKPGEMLSPAGVSWFLKRGEEVAGLTAAPLYQSRGEYGWEFSDGRAAWTCRRGGLSARTEVSLSPNGDGELRRAELTWEDDSPLEGELWCYLEPVLCPQADYQAHPAFSKLFLESERLPDGVLFRRRPRGREEYPALAALWSGEAAEFTASRESALGRGGLRALAGGRIKTDGAVGGIPDPCLLVRWNVRLRKGESFRAALALGASDSRSQAASGARELLKEEKPGRAGCLSALARRLELGEEQVTESCDLLRRLCAVEAPWPERPSQRELWPFGVSGDVPIMAGVVTGEDDLLPAQTWMAQQQLLSRGGFPCDLVLLLEEGGDYRRPLRTALLERLKALGGEGALGQKGGIHLLEQGDGCAPILHWAKVRLPLEPFEQKKELWRPLTPVGLEREPAEWEWSENGDLVIHAGDRLPPVGWSQVLCSRDFGWLTDETGNGFLWKGNSREGRLTSWSNDPLAVGGEECITVTVGGVTASVFAGGDGRNCRVTYGPGFARWEKEFSNTVLTVQSWVPEKGDLRRLLFSLNKGEGTLWYRFGEEHLHFSLVPGVPALLTTRPGKRGGITSRFTPAPAEIFKELEATKVFWERLASPLIISTPDSALDRYVNRWSLYQVAACRLFARTSQYQNGGAYGFRDQLQDACALLCSSPELTREQLLRSAGRQFLEGDVQHWWHPPQGGGIRTRISDDLLWLPYVLERYVHATGDWGLCREQAPFLRSAPLGPEEQERYETPQVTRETGTLYRHACLAIDCSLSRGRGSHGLGLMGTGDWNDGMNRVGERGKGESVWLTWFTALVLDRFSPICEKLGEPERGERYRALAQEYRQAAEGAFDGKWYLRGYFDSGEPLGSSSSPECRIDSIAQSFAVFAGGDPGHTQTALDSALEMLYDRERKLFKLLSPAFDGKGPDPGYIRGYLPGVRENGGQYTHAAVWLAMALLRAGRAGEGWELLSSLLPERHPTGRYRAEPNVLAADVYASAGNRGRGGWSWYTGAAGWYYRAAVEDLLGLRVVDGRLYLRPNLPDAWPGYKAAWRLPGGELDIEVKRTGTPSMTLDGREMHSGVELSKLHEKHYLKATF